MALQLATMLVALGLASRLSAQEPTPQPTRTFTTGQDGRITGYILSRRGDQILVKDETTKQIALVSLTPTTVVERPSGFMKMSRRDQPDDMLIPGLLIIVRGDGGSRGELVANRVKFTRRGYQVASQAAAGEVELKARVKMTDMRLAAAKDSLLRARTRGRDSLDAVNDRISNLDNFEMRSSSTILFAVNSFDLSADSKRALDGVAQQVQGLDGYMIEVYGFADPTGENDKNFMLSQARARTAASYLTAMHRIPSRRIATPSGLGTSHPVASNMTTNGRAMNRRAEIKVLVNKGVSKP
jgi:outer membrane protein OmpA-like peptidoglycan-associated protein